MLLQIPTMANDEHVFHYSQGLKNRISVELERSEIASVTEAMRIADHIDSIYTRGSFPYQEGFGNWVTPTEIGNVPRKYKFEKLSPEDNVRAIIQRKYVLYM